MDVSFNKLSSVYCFFFFQAEDGIRDAQESRGLGDVYKRQVKGGGRFRKIDPVLVSQVTSADTEIDIQHRYMPKAFTQLGQIVRKISNHAKQFRQRHRGNQLSIGTVSYTHLTLPTIYSV